MTALASSSFDRCPASEYITPATMDSVAPMLIIDSRGNRIPFGSIFEFQQTVVVFIRHFFCKMCHSYVSNLARVSPDALDAAGTKIVIIGCGAWDMIPSYQGTTGFRGLVYSDPTGKLHDALGLQKLSSSSSSSSSSSQSQSTKGDKQAPSYLLEHQPPKKGIFESLKRPIDGLRGRNGNTSQLGGDLVLGPGNVCVYAHRMRSTTDHVEIPDLLALVDVRPHTAVSPMLQQQQPVSSRQQHGRGGSIPLGYASTQNQTQNVVPNVAYVLPTTGNTSPPASIGDVSNPERSVPNPLSNNPGTHQRKRASTTSGGVVGNFNSRDRTAAIPNLPLLAIPSESNPSRASGSGSGSASGSISKSTSMMENRERRRSMRPTTTSSSSGTPYPSNGIQPASSFSSSSSHSSHHNNNPAVPSRLGIITRRPSTATTTGTNTSMSMSPTPPLTPTTPDRTMSSSSFNYFNTNNPGSQSPIDRNIISPSLRSSIGLLNSTSPTPSATGTSAGGQQPQPHRTSRKDKRRTITNDNFRVVERDEGGDGSGMSYYGYVKRALDDMDQPSSTSQPPRR